MADRIAEDLLAAVLASPRAVAAHDKTAWVGLFTEQAAVHDPYGSRAHIGPEAISRFYNVFIAPNTIAFRVERDIVAGHTVVRDLHIETTMSTGATVVVPMHLRYDLVAADGGWRISRLAAHWELGVMVGRLMRTGSAGVLAGAKLGPQLIGELGVGGAMGMMRALRGVGRHGKRIVRGLFVAAADGDSGRVQELLGRASVRVGSGDAVSPAEFGEMVRSVQCDKVIAAGRTVSVSVRRGESGGVVFVDFASGSSRIECVTVYLGG